MFMYSGARGTCCLCFRFGRAARDVEGQRTGVGAGGWLG
ncbi:uncharacterized protein CTRU02_211148 [Colletotrichum truncatum]|uniref:Uncharacterized protein n=1 Tax=Colletotrichum truncatum TaxID=5467 RepID=A0ACC3YQZ3_COLTU|nr:uncharacterized protein CTRU02_01928 [Colletotrichum truncatum]KAF6799057.1 hypothetical protein CTRU02_01928 [Colletotrichum truncatum]